MMKKNLSQSTYPVLTSVYKGWLMKHKRPAEFLKTIMQAFKKNSHDTQQVLAA
jgi:hypothetical protein